MRHLLLFDIDGTLLKCGPQLHPFLSSALAEVYGRHHPLERFTFSGKTDPQIVLELVRGIDGFDDAAILDRVPSVRELYLERLEAGLERDRMTLLPGVVELLDRLAERDDLALGLLTGNWRGGAMIKLSRFELERYFALGAFGDDAVDRPHLVPVAVERARTHWKRDFAPEEVVIIGDSERDVDCAKRNGAVAVAVATGRRSAEDLRADGADHVFEDLVVAAREFELFR